MASASNGVYDTSSPGMDGVKKQFERYQDGLREGYLIVEVHYLTVVTHSSQTLVKQMESLLSKTDKHDGEVHNLLHRIRDLERENAMLKDRVKKDDQAMVQFLPKICS